MNFIDGFILFFLGLAVIDGWRAGWFVLLVDLIVFLLSLALAFTFFEPVGQVVGGLIGLSTATKPFIGFSLLFVIAYGSMRFLSLRFAQVWPHMYRTAVLNRVGGALVNLVKQSVGVGVVLNLLLFLPVVPLARSGILDSRFAGAFIIEDPFFEQAVSKVIEPAVFEAQQFITTKEIDDSPVPLDFPVGTLEIDLTAERVLFDLVNTEREQRNLPMLTWNDQLAKVARLHSRDMWKRQFFAHVNPDGADPFDRLRQGSVSYFIAGENLALAPTTPIAHDGLMDSPGHRANILDPNYAQLGIGAIRNGLYGATYTQLFTN